MNRCCPLPPGHWRLAARAFHSPNQARAYTEIPLHRLPAVIARTLPIAQLEPSDCPDTLGSSQRAREQWRGHRWSTRAQGRVETPIAAPRAVELLRALALHKLSWHRCTATRKQLSCCKAGALASPTIWVCWTKSIWRAWLSTARRFVACPLEASRRSDLSLTYGVQVTFHKLASEWSGQRAALLARGRGERGEVRAAVLDRLADALVEEAGGATLTGVSDQRADADARQAEAREQHIATSTSSPQRPHGSREGEAERQSGTGPPRGNAPDGPEMRTTATSAAPLNAVLRPDRVGKLGLQLDSNSAGQNIVLAVQAGNVRTSRHWSCSLILGLPA